VQSTTEAKLAPNLPGWMVEHATRYLSKTEREIPVVVLDAVR
jgi:hypothetical protein